MQKSLFFLVLFLLGILSVACAGSNGDSSVSVRLPKLSEDGKLIITDLVNIAIEVKNPYSCVQEFELRWEQKDWRITAKWHGGLDEPLRLVKGVPRVTIPPGESKMLAVWFVIESLDEKIEIEMPELALVPVSMEDKEEACDKETAGLFHNIFLQL